jgi:Putative adhesin
VKEKGVSLMKSKTFGRMVPGISAAMLVSCGLLMMCSGAAQAQEKRTIFTEDNFHWQAKLAPGQTLEIIGRNGEIEANGAADTSAEVNAIRRGHGDSEKEAFIEVVEYSDGVTICAVYAREAKPGRCHRGGVDSESGNFWHNSRAKITFSAKVPRGVVLKAETTNGDIHARSLNSVVEADTTNGSVDVSTSEWASGRSTNGHVDVTMGKAGWNGELELATTNGGITVSLPASAEFKVRASTTNGNIRTDFPITVQGTFGTKNVSGTVGAGGRELKLATTNGGIEVRKSGA